jgi:hypothetical protein
MAFDQTRMAREIRTVARQCGGERELALLLHVQPRSIWGYRAAKYRPSKFVCLQLARICRTLDGPDQPRADPNWWLALDREDV